LARLLDEPAFADGGGGTAIYASLPAAGAARAIAKAFAEQGPGAPVDVEAGARVDDGPHRPVRLPGVVVHACEGDPDAGATTVVRTGGLHAILNARRK